MLYPSIENFENLITTDQKLLLKMLELGKMGRVLWFRGGVGGRILKRGCYFLYLDRNRGGN
jgi:hypothetical protein